MSAQAALQCGFGNFLGDALFEVKGQRFTIVRLDLQKSSDADTTALAQEAIDAGLQPLCIVRRSSQMALLPSGALVELGNEPDITSFGWTREEYRQEAERCVAVAAQSRQRLYLGAVSNLNPRGFSFLMDLDWHRYPPEICCSVHRYPNGNTPLAPHHGCSSREDEVRKLRTIVGPRPLACTEVGYHDGPGSPWNEQAVASHMAWERRFFSDQGFDFVVGFQINDGPNTDTESHYGFRRLDGSWKPVAASFTEAL